MVAHRRPVVRTAPPVGGGGAAPAPMLEAYADAKGVAPGYTPGYLQGEYPGARADRRESAPARSRKGQRPALPRRATRPLLIRVGGSKVAPQNARPRKAASTQDDRPVKISVPIGVETHARLSALSALRRMPAGALAAEFIRDGLKTAGVVVVRRKSAEEVDLAGQGKESASDAA